MSVITVTTGRGFSYAVEEDALNDMELLEDMVALDSGDGRALITIGERLLGAGGKRKLYENLRTEKGRVPADEVTRELFDIIKGLKDGKK